MTEDWLNKFEPTKDIDEDCLIKDLERLYEEIEKRILEYPENIAEIKRVAKEFNEKEEFVLILAVLKCFAKMEIISQKDIKNIMCGR